MRRTPASHNLDRRLCLHIDMSCARFNQEDKQKKKNILQYSIYCWCVLKTPPRNFINQISFDGTRTFRTRVTCDRHRQLFLVLFLCVSVQFFFTFSFFFPPSSSSDISQPTTIMLLRRSKMCRPCSCPFCN